MDEAAGGDVDKRYDSDADGVFAGAGIVSKFVLLRKNEGPDGEMGDAAVVALAEAVTARKLVSDCSNSLNALVMGVPTVGGATVVVTVAIWSGFRRLLDDEASREGWSIPFSSVSSILSLLPLLILVVDDGSIQDGGGQMYFGGAMGE